MTVSSALTLALVLSSAQPILQALPAGKDLPPGLTVDVVVGDVERQGKPAEGMIKLTAPAASQVVYWRQTSSLPAAAKAKAKPAPTLVSQYVNVDPMSPETRNATLYVLPTPAWVLMSPAYWS